MIRFSAGLVVVAIGVLIGGVVTSKLSLVYVAIAVSAVALVVLAIGVALKRDELFGGGPELAPAGAGAGSGIPVGHSVGAGDVRGKAGRVREDQQQIQPKKVPGPATAAFEAAAAAQASALAASASAAAPTVAAPLVTTPVTTTPPVTSPTVGSPTRGPAEDNSPFGNPPLANRRAAFSQASAPEGDSAADWQTRSPQPPWSSGDQVRSAWTPEKQTPIAAPPTVPQSGAAAVSPRPWGSPDQSPAPTTRAESGTVAPSWFDRLNKPAAVPVAQTRTDQATVVDPAKAEPQQAEPQQAEPQQAEPQQAEPTKAADPSDAVTDTDIDDDDWPTRYSWLDDDETDEAAEADKLAEISDVAEVAGTVPADATAVEPVVAEPAVAESDSPDAESADADAEGHGATTDDVETAADPADDTAETDEPGATLAVDAAHEDADEPPAPQPVGSKLVTVIPGVPRYHDPDCILIRFMDEEDIARKSIPEAKAANCTPCAACQPEG